MVGPQKKGPGLLCRKSPVNSEKNALMTDEVFWLVKEIVFYWEKDFFVGYRTIGRFRGRGRFWFGAVGVGRRCGGFRERIVTGKERFAKRCY